MILKNFQKKAVEELSEKFLELWKLGDRNIKIIFKAPTGSGKTIMMAEFLKTLDQNFDFRTDKAYIWISFSEDSYNQSKDKLWAYFNEGTDLQLKDLTNLNEEQLYTNDVFFINWQKIKAGNRSKRSLRKETERTETALFDDYIKNTHEKDREIVMMVDEAHTHLNTNLSEEIIDLIKPKIMIKITATPKDEKEYKSLSFDKKAGFIEVKEEDVKKEGLIKLSTITQTEEELNKQKDKKLDKDLLLLELAFAKRQELLKFYKQNNIRVNPLVLIQLPNDYKETEEIRGDLKEKLSGYLVDKGVKGENIAVWLSKEKENLDLVHENNGRVEFLFFKQAAATGWDCPRAQILVMYREIKSPVFTTQTIGRIRRMPEAKHYKNPELNKCYIYTDFNKEQIRDVTEPESENKPAIHFVEKKENIKPVKLNSIFMGRIDFNTLSPSQAWQDFFMKFMDKETGTKDQLVTENVKIIKNSRKIISDSSKIDNKMIVDTKIESYDNFMEEFKKKAQEKNFDLTQTDEEKIYNLFCFNELKGQEKKDAKFSPSRSWGTLKSSLNVWFGKRLENDKEKKYRIIINNFCKNPEFKKIIEKALIEFNNQIYLPEIENKERKEDLDLEVPQKERSYTDDFQELKEVKKNCYNKFYIRKKYIGRINEEEFIRYLERRKNIEWWHKQEDKGRDEFGLLYYDEEEKKERLFYPDFLIKTKDRFYILDPKKGQTETSPNTENKAKALQKWIKENQKHHDIEIIGGMVRKNNAWEINKEKDYKNSGWETLKI